MPRFPDRDTGRTLRRRFLILVALLSLALPAGAQAAGATSSTPTPASALDGSTSPFAVGVPQPAAATTATATTPTVAASTTSTSTNGSFGTADIVLIVGGVAVVIIGTWLYVIRDARKTARHLKRGTSAASAGGVNHPGSKPTPRARKLSAQEKKRRKRGKAPRRR